jgi:hypothetical protein
MEEPPAAASRVEEDAERREEQRRQHDRTEDQAQTHRLQAVAGVVKGASGT